ncbi:monocarboxylate transporter 13-like [Mytilus californianus]|uniref:monocarboxylate transporter 13-like n=1 Tax=Mytilus californianus TaxID=6549 RepID=UPI002246032E|nr:monocarboxylate transporter 13-like [Mytilus californianus]
MCCIYDFKFFIREYKMSMTNADKGWALIILVAAFVENCLVGFSLYAIGLIHIIFLEKFKKEITLTSWISASFICLLSLTGPLASYCIGRWDCRVTMIMGSLLMTTSLVVTAFVNNILLAFIFFGVLAGLGVGLMFTTGLIVIAFNFEKKRNLATGIAVAGCGIGPFILSPIYQMIYNEYGYNGFFLFYAGLSFNVCVVGAVLRPSRLEVSSKMAKNRNRMLRKKYCEFDLTVVQNIPLFFVCISGVFFNIGIFIIYLHFPAYAIENNSTQMEVSWYLSIAGISSCIGRVLLGMATNSDDVNEDIVFFGTYSLIGAATIVVPLFIKIHYAKIMYSIVLGMNSGSCYVVISTIVLRLTGPDHVAHGTGYVMAYIGIGSLVGPPLAGVIVDNGGSYASSFIIAGLSLILGGFTELCNVCFKTDLYNKPAIEEIEMSIGDKEIISKYTHAKEEKTVLT